MANVKTVHDYLKNLESNVSSLPKHERDRYLEEVENDLIELKEEFLEDGESFQEAENKAIASFENVHLLSQNILREHKYAHGTRDTTYGAFNGVLAAVTIPIGLFTSPLFSGEINANIAGTLTFGSILFIAGFVILIKKYNQNLNNTELKALKLFYVVMFPFLALGIFGFMYNLSQFGELRGFTIMYFVGFLLLWSIVFLILFRINKENQRAAV